MARHAALLGAALFAVVALPQSVAAQSASGAVGVRVTVVQAVSARELSVLNRPDVKQYASAWAELTGPRAGSPGPTSPRPAGAETRSAGAEPRITCPETLCRIPPTTTEPQRAAARVRVIVPDL